MEQQLTAPQPERKKRIFSGIQPTGVMTLGNYLGAVRQLGPAAGGLRLHLLHCEHACHHRPARAGKAAQKTLWTPTP